MYFLIRVCISFSWEKLIFLSLRCPSAWHDRAAAASGFAPASPEAQGAARVRAVLGKVRYAAQPRWLCTGLLAEITIRGNGQRSTDGFWCPCSGNADSGGIYGLICPKWPNPATSSSSPLFSIFFTQGFTSKISG